MHTGSSRTSVQPNHALITPESHVPLLLPGWDGAEVVVLISAEMGAKFSQYLARCSAGAQVDLPAGEHERLLMVLDGALQLTLPNGVETLVAEHFAFVPAGQRLQAASPEGCTLLMFEKRYVPVPGVELPQAFVRPLADVPAEPFLGDEGALLQVLLPADDPAQDWGINVFEFVPGGTLPQVESHFMEHGVYFLGGQGVYRLGECWYPIEQGDAIWMGPYEPQWYVAAGKTPSRYIYYKEMNRAPIG